MSRYEWMNNLSKGKAKTKEIPSEKKVKIQSKYPKFYLSRNSNKGI